MLALQALIAITINCPLVAAFLQPGGCVSGPHSFPDERRDAPIMS
jgi:hypothetical protein